MRPLGHDTRQPLLSALLPHLRDSIHDPAEKVRSAFLDLLAAVKGMRDIKVHIIGLNSRCDYSPVL